jgi:hypothetical protein
MSGRKGPASWAGKGSLPSENRLGSDYLMTTTIINQEMREGIIRHWPVMAGNVLARARQFPRVLPLRVADCNFGLGGHSSMLLQHFPKAMVYSCKDPGRPTTWTRPWWTTSRSTTRDNSARSSAAG